MQDLIDQYDNSNVLGSINALPLQIEDAWQAVSQLKLPDLSSQISNIVLVGMGGSALGARVIKPLYQDSLNCPFEIVNNYHLPKYTNDSTLVILSSYSGTTEEVLSAAKEAEQIKCPAVVIAAGGNLLEIAKKNSWPFYQIDPQHNPSNQPRMAIGYAISGTLAILNQIQLLKIDHSELMEAVTLLQQNSNLYLPDQQQNLARTTAQSLLDKTINLISSDHLTGAVHVTNNQLNENSKHLSAEYLIPELNHHYLEALTFPESAKDHQAYLFFDSKLYLPQNQTRLHITKKLIEEKGYQTHTFTAQSPTKLTQVFEVIQFGAFLNFYTSMLHHIDPAPIPSVDYFKSELKKSS